MAQLLISIDPDAKKYGVAVHVDGKLRELHSMDVVQFSKFLAAVSYENPVFVIEDVQANKFMYNRGIQSPSVLGRVAQNVGECKHSQRVAEAFIESYGFELVRQKPIKGNWAKNKKQFEQVTGWTGRSNEDTRSAAFMGFLYLNKVRQGKLKCSNT